LKENHGVDPLSEKEDYRPDSSDRRHVAAKEDVQHRAVDDAVSHEEYKWMANTSPAQAPGFDTPRTMHLPGNRANEVGVESLAEAGCGRVIGGAHQAVVHRDVLDVKVVVERCREQEAPKASLTSRPSMNQLMGNDYSAVAR
jgi:hypothetical protein